MNWKHKALAYNILDRLPSDIGYAVHYLFQRKFGGMRHPDAAMEHVQAAVTIADYVAKTGGSLASKSFLEIGPGRHLTLPITLWLSGASRIISVDINPYLKASVVFDSIDYMRNHRAEISSLIGVHRAADFQERFRRLMEVPPTLHDLFATLPIEYLAPADASRLRLVDKSIDFCISFNVMEFIPRKTLRSIILEGNRILAPGGLHIHSVDFSDWFAASDESISGINFLQFNEEEWGKYAGNRYMYHNRLRVDDFISLFQSSGLRIVALDPVIDERAMRLLKNGFILDKRFRDKPSEINATRNAWFVAGQAPGV